MANQSYIYHVICTGEQNGNLNGMTGDNQRNTPVPNGESTGTLKNSNVWHNTRKMIYVKNNVSSGFWPVPESFWPDDHTVTLASVRVLLPAMYVLMAVTPV